MILEEIHSHICQVEASLDRSVDEVRVAQNVWAILFRDLAEEGSDDLFLWGIPLILDETLPPNRVRLIAVES